MTNFIFKSIKKNVKVIFLYIQKNLSIQYRNKADFRQREINLAHFGKCGSDIVGKTI